MSANKVTNLILNLWHSRPLTNRKLVAFNYFLQVDMNMQIKKNIFFETNFGQMQKKLRQSEKENLQ